MAETLQPTPADLQEAADSGRPGWPDESGSATARRLAHAGEYA